MIEVMRRQHISTKHQMFGKVLLFNMLSCFQVGVLGENLFYRRTCEFTHYFGSLWYSLYIYIIKHFYCSLCNCLLQLAKKLHPDTNKDDADAERKFQEVQRAYEVTYLHAILGVIRSSNVKFYLIVIV